MRGLNYTPVRKPNKKNKKKRENAFRRHLKWSGQTPVTAVTKPEEPCDPVFSFEQLPPELCVLIARKFSPQAAVEFASSDPLLMKVILAANLTAAYFNIEIGSSNHFFVSYDDAIQEEHSPEPNRITITPEKHLVVTFNRVVALSARGLMLAGWESGMRFGICLWKENGSYFSGYVTMFHQFIGNMFNIFKGPVNLMKIDLRFANLNELRNTERLRTCTSLMIKGSPGTVRQASEVLDFVTVNEHLFIQSPHVLHEQMFTVPRLVYVHRIPTQIDDWERFNNQVLRVNANMGEDGEAVKVLLRSWMAGDKPNLQVLTVTDVHMNFETVWDDLNDEFEFKEFDPVERDPNFVMSRKNDPTQLYRLNCRDGIDVENKNGVLGTLVVRPEENRVLHFFVWHDRWPERRVIGKSGLTFHNSAGFWNFHEMMNYNYEW